MNLFDNIDSAKSKIKLQQRSEGAKIKIKKAGRPARPNMVRKVIKVDRVLYGQLAEYAKSQHTTIAHLLSIGIKKILNDD